MNPGSNPGSNFAAPSRVRVPWVRPYPLAAFLLAGPTWTLRAHPGHSFHEASLAHWVSHWDQAAPWLLGGAALCWVARWAGSPFRRRGILGLGMTTLIAGVGVWARGR